MRKAWFRHKSIGYGVTPASWEGWLCLLALLVVVVATMVLLGDPSAAKARAIDPLMRLRAEVGLSAIRLPFAARIALVAGEVLAFLAFARTRTAPDAPR